MSRKFNAQGQVSSLFHVPGYGTVLAAGTTAPSDGASGYGKGCLFIKTDASGGTDTWWQNIGTAASADFDVLPSVAEMAVLDGVTFSSTVTELNLLSGLLATAAEINRFADKSTNIVNVTTTPLALSLATHEGKVVTVNKADGCAITLPAATGSGARYRILIGTTITSGETTIGMTGDDTMFGRIYQCDTSDDSMQAYECPGSTVITLNGTTKGGIKGDWFELEDVAADVWYIEGHMQASGSETSPVT